jgi:hypothetical protein
MNQPTAEKPRSLRESDGTCVSKTEVSRFFRRTTAQSALWARPALVALVLYSSIAFASRADAGLIITWEQPSEFQGADGSLTQPVQGDSSDKPLQHFVVTPHESIPSGAGAACGGSSTGLVIVGVLVKPCGFIASPALSSSLEERRLSLPASPVFDRLRPPRVS